METSGAYHQRKGRVTETTVLNKQDLTKSSLPCSAINNASIQMSEPVKNLPINGIVQSPSL